MRKTHHPPNQIITKLRTVEAARAEGQTIAEAVRSIGVTENTYYRWKRKYGSMDRDQLKRLKDLGADECAAEETRRGSLPPQGHFEGGA